MSAPKPSSSAPESSSAGGERISLPTLLSFALSFAVLTAMAVFAIAGLASLTGLVLLRLA